MPGLGASFGRGAATTYQQDLANSDCILFMGSNMAEAHPVGFRWPMKAKQRGAKLIHVDPRFSSTSAVCDMHVAIRPGSDIAFLGGIINYILTHEKWFKEYVLAYTNASTLIEEGFKDTEDLDGVFSGFDAAKRSYDPGAGRWSYEKSAADATLQHPRCVMQLLRRHFARYTPEFVAEVCGCRPQQMIQVAELLCANSGRERTTAFVYALGWTQHSTGVQMIRAAGIIQLLLGNIGRPGGGIMAMRGHVTIQGSTDLATLNDLLPGYLAQPVCGPKHEKLADYLKNETPPSGYWVNKPKFLVSLLKAWYGSAATPQNDFCFNWLPRLDGDYSQLPYFNQMASGQVKGYFLFGQNPAGGGPNARLHRAGLGRLEWLVVLDWFPHESATFWKDDPTGPPSSEIGTEVFFFPAASITEKEGSFTNTQRMLQWHDKAVDPPHDCRSDLWFVYNLGKLLKQLYSDSTDPRDEPIRQLTCDYDYDEPPALADGSVSRIEGEPDANKVLQEINGWKTNERDPKTGKPKLLGDFGELKDDGSTACGCWIYAGVFPEYDRNRARERNLGSNPVQPEWGFAWPRNRRIMYNRASADPQGRPWSERKKYIWWDEQQRRWVGFDEPDFEPTKPPDYRPPPGAQGMEAISGSDPFIMKTDGRGWLFAPSGVKDGPLPTHYEPIESPLSNRLHPQHPVSPVVRTFPGPLNVIAATPESEYPVVATTFRVTEHYLSGPMSRFNSWLNELQPQMFIEMGVQLAEERGVRNGDWVIVTSPRGQIEARALVTARIKPLIIDGRQVHQIGVPFHWGYAGEVVGSVANDLTSLLADPNVSMHEAKAFVCEVRRGRAQRQPTQPSVPEAPWPYRDPIPDTPLSAQPEGHLR